MKAINRFIAWVVIIVVVFGLILSGFAIAASWAVNAPITNGILNVLSGVQTGLNAVGNSLERLDVTLSSSRELVQTIQSTANQLGDKVEQSSPVLTLLSKTVNEDLATKINSARESVIAIRDAVVAFNTTLEALNSVPFVNVPTLTDQLQSVSDKLADLALVVEDLRSMVSQVKTGVVETLVTPITQTASRIDSELASIQQNVGSYIEQVNGVSEVVATLQAKVPVWIDIISIALSIFFLWIILAQLSMLAIARGYLKTGYVPWTYRLAPAEPQLPSSTQVEVQEEQSVEKPDAESDAEPDAEGEQEPE